MLSVAQEGLQPVADATPGILEQVVAADNALINETLPGIVNTIAFNAGQAGDNHLIDQVVSTVNIAVNDTVPHIVDTLVAGLHAEGGDAVLPGISLDPVAAHILVPETVVDYVASEAAPLVDTLDIDQSLHLNLAANLDHDASTPLASGLLETVGTVAATPILEVVAQPALGTVVEPALEHADIQDPVSTLSAVADTVDSQIVTPLAGDPADQTLTSIIDHAADENCAPATDAITPVVTATVEYISGEACTPADPVVAHLASENIEGHAVGAISAIGATVEGALAPVVSGGIDLASIADTGRATLTDFVNDTPPVQAVVSHASMPTAEFAPIALHVDTSAGAAIAPAVSTALPMFTVDLGADTGVHLDSNLAAAIATTPSVIGDLALSTMGASGSGVIGTATPDSAAHSIVSTAAHLADGSWLTAGSNGTHGGITPVSEPIHIDTSHSAHHWL